VTDERCAVATTNRESDKEVDEVGEIRDYMVSRQSLKTGKGIHTSILKEAVNHLHHTGCVLDDRYLGAFLHLHRTKR
jgi:hypothetical protein